MLVNRNIKERGQLQGADSRNQISPPPTFIIVFVKKGNNRRFSLCTKVGLLLGPLPLWWLTEYTLKLSHSDAFLWLLAKPGIIRYWTKGPFFSLWLLYNTTDALWSWTTPARHTRFFSATHQTWVTLCQCSASPSYLWHHHCICIEGIEWGKKLGMWNHVSMWFWLNNWHGCLDKMLKCIWFKVQEKSNEWKWVLNIQKQ